MSEKQSGFSSDWYFEPSGASEVGETADKLQNFEVTGDFATDAKNFLMAIGQGSKALDRGDLEKVRTELQSLLSGEHVVKHLDVAPNDRHLEEDDQAAIKRVLGKILNDK